MPAVWEKESELSDRVSGFLGLTSPAPLACGLNNARLSICSCWLGGVVDGIETLKKLRLVAGGLGRSLRRLSLSHNGKGGSGRELRSSQEVAMRPAEPTKLF